MERLVRGPDWVRQRLFSNVISGTQPVLAVVEPADNPTSPVRINVSGVAVNLTPKSIEYVTSRTPTELVEYRIRLRYMLDHASHAERRRVEQILRLVDERLQEFSTDELLAALDASSGLAYEMAATWRLVTGDRWSPYVLLRHPARTTW